MTAAPSFLSAIVLAAGESRRMGDRNKLLLSFRNQPLIAHIVQTVVQSDVDEVIVVLGHQAAQVREVLAAYDVVFTHNPRYREGMTTSIHAGVQAASEAAAGFMICLSDLPLIEPKEFNRLTAAFREAMQQDLRHIIRPVYQGKPGNPVLFPAYYKPAILAQQGVTGCKGIIKQNRPLVLEIEMETDHVLRDVDTPEAYAALSSNTDT